MTPRKKILFYSLLILLTLAALEGMARIAYYLAYGEGYSTPQPAPPAAAVDFDPRELFTPVIIGAHDQSNKILHPYFGYTPDTPTSVLNTMPPRQTRDDQVVIGLTGGSVALFLAPEFRRAIERHFAEQGLDKEPVVIPLAIAGSRQPQQMNVVSYMLAMGGGFDFIVNLDGFNEIQKSAVNFQTGVFPFFPTAWSLLNQLTSDEIVIAGRTLTLRAELAGLQQNRQGSPFRHSAVYGLVNRYRIQRVDDRILQLNYALTEIKTGRSLEKHGPRGNFRDVADVHREAVRVWYRTSAMLARLAASAGADYYHFLQPNQYIPDSKPLSPAELELAYDRRRAENLGHPETYRLLVQYGQELQQRRVNYFDLTRIFRDHPETLYIDQCCHLNERGNELLAAAIVQRMAPALLRHSQANSPATDSMLAVAAPLPLPPDPKPVLQADRIDPSVAPQFQVSRRYGNFLAYEKDNCAPEHTQPRFFLHIIPVLAADLPENRQEHGFENRDFGFLSDGGSRIDGHCLIERPLPDYPIARIRTGQLNSAGEIWAVELSLPE